MASLTTLMVLVVGVIIGLLLGLTGGGGSILTVPLLVYVVGLEAKIAISTSLLIVGLASLAALLPHSRAGNVYWRMGLVFGVAGMAGAYCGGRLAQFIGDALLLLLFAAVMVGSGTAMLRKKAAATPAQAGQGDAAAAAPRSWSRIIGDGFIVGIVTGLVGAGGGFLVVPALVLLGGMPMHAAVGTSLLVIALKCFAGLAGYISHARPDADTAIIVSALAIAGTVAGSRLSRRLSGTQLQRGFGAFVLGVAAILIIIEGGGLVATWWALSRVGASALVAAVVALAVVVFGAGLRARQQTPPALRQK